MSALQIGGEFRSSRSTILFSPIAGGPCIHLLTLANCQVSSGPKTDTGRQSVLGLVSFIAITFHSQPASQACVQPASQSLTSRLIHEPSHLFLSLFFVTIIVLRSLLTRYLSFSVPLRSSCRLSTRCFDSWGTIAGMVILADRYLLEWEREHRIASERWRSVARNGLSFFTHSSSKRSCLPCENAMADDDAVWMIRAGSNGDRAVGNDDAEVEEGERRWLRCFIAGCSSGSCDSSSTCYDGLEVKKGTTLGNDAEDMIYVDGHVSITFLSPLFIHIALRILFAQHCTIPVISLREQEMHCNNSAPSISKRCWRK